MSFKKDVKKLTNKLQADYMCNLQNYPRIENDYIDYKLHSLYPHLPFRRITPEYNVIKVQKLKLERKSSLLFLSQKRLISPSQIISYSETIDNFFDENLFFKNQQKEQELLLLKKLMLEFLTNELKTQEYIEQKDIIIKKYNDIYDNAKSNFSIKFYKNDSISFFHFSTSSTDSNRKSEPILAFESYYYKKMKKEEQTKKEEYLLHRARMFDCIEEFQYLKRKNNVFTVIDEKISDVLSKYE